jgi:hypothetical protein
MGHCFLKGQITKALEDKEVQKFYERYVTLGQRPFFLLSRKINNKDGDGKPSPSFRCPFRSIIGAGEI